MMKKANYQAGKLLDQRPGHVDALIIQAISNGYIARQYSNREEWISSLNYGRKAMNANEKLKNLESDLDDLKLAEGLKKYYTAYLPEAYPIVKTVSWMLPEGDKEEGLSLLREASQNAIFARAEATYFLGNIAFNYEKEYMTAVHHFVELQKEYPRNNYYARLLVKSYYRLRHYGKALEYIETTLRQWDNEDFPKQKILQEELWTWKGQIVEQMGNTDEALGLYKSAFELSEELPNTESRSFWMASGFKAGNILAKRGEHEEARHYLEKVAGASRSSDYRNKARDLLSELD
jgi:tetratricopeptide (TPR) repeat protein